MGRSKFPQRCPLWSTLGRLRDQSTEVDDLDFARVDFRADLPRVTGVETVDTAASGDGSVRSKMDFLGGVLVVGAVSRSVV